ncbi:alkaline phosphatase family protein [Chitinophaga parva]|nr:alkaline phosphatase family protein [Chitinophaga parva]
MKKLILCAATLVAAFHGMAQQRKTENIVIVTMDGMRWQEIFGGVDTALAHNEHFAPEGQESLKNFGADSTASSRERLLPFFWGTIAKQGQLYGNRSEGNLVNVANRYQFSYPGYNEMFTGYPDTLVNSNDKNYNKNTTVLEYINQQPGFKGKVAAFSTWDAFPYILNMPRSGVYVNAAMDSIPATTPALTLIGEQVRLSPKYLGGRPDEFTYMAGREYLKANHPRVLYIAFDDTDEFAHAGKYDEYLKQAHAEDAMLADLWHTLQSQPQYKNKTTLIVLCDHGRGGAGLPTWTSHGQDVKESGQIWMAFLGPDTRALGEIKTQQQVYQQQIAATIAGLLGMQFSAAHPVAPPLTHVF